MRFCFWTHVVWHLYCVQIHVEICLSSFELVKNCLTIYVFVQVVQCLSQILGGPLVDIVIEFEFLKLFRCLSRSLLLLFQLVLRCDLLLCMVLLGPLLTFY